MRSLTRWLGSQWGANLRSALEYRASFLLQVVFMALNNFIFLAFWAVFFARFESVDGWDMKAVALLYATCATGFGLGVLLCGGCFELARKIAEGALDTWLLRPRPVFLQAATARLKVSGLGDLASGLLLFVLSGHAQPERWAAFVVGSLAGAVVFVAFMTAIHALAFFLGHAEGLAQHGVMGLVVFACYPPSLFGGAARVALYVLVPAGFMSHLPAALVLHWTWADAALLGAGVAGFVGLAALTWRAGLRRYESGNLTQSVQA